jgi:hypothetical protein
MTQSWHQFVPFVQLLFQISNLFGEQFQLQIGFVLILFEFLGNLGLQLFTTVAHGT